VGTKQGLTGRGENRQDALRNDDSAQMQLAQKFFLEKIAQIFFPK